MQISRCPQCGSTFSYPDGHVPSFCSACGAEIPVPVKEPVPAEAPAEAPVPAAAERIPASAWAAKPRIYERTEIIGAALSYLAF